MTPKDLITKHWLVITGVAIGALAGYLYWRLVGCSTGTCPITSSPFMSTLWGAIMGGLIFDIFNKKKNKQDE